jgi:hypothetical protein
MSIDINVSLAVGFRISGDRDVEEVERLCEELEAVYWTEGNSYTGDLSYIVGPKFATEGTKRTNRNWTFGAGATFEIILALAPALERIRAGLAERGFTDLRALVLPAAFVF